MCTAAVGSHIYAIGGTGAKADDSQQAGEILDACEFIDVNNPTWIKVRVAPLPALLWPLDHWRPVHSAIGLSPAWQIGPET